MATDARNHKPHRQNTVESLYFAPGNFVRPGEESAWKTFNNSFWDSLAPTGPVEAFLVTELVRAAWRIRRCNNVEAGLIDSLSNPALDPMLDSATSDTQNTLDRARSQAERGFQHSLDELRRVQTERQFRNESFPAGTDLSAFGSASFKQIIPALRAPGTSKRATDELEKIQREIEKQAAIAKQPATPQPPAVAHVPQPTTQPATPRNAPCPCGSGEKHKRCCGKNAPPVLGCQSDTPVSKAA
jgi:hypothetical protein